MCARSSGWMKYVQIGEDVFMEEEKRGMARAFFCVALYEYCMMYKSICLQLNALHPPEASASCV